MQSMTQMFSEWVGKQDPEAGYSFIDADNCAYARFEKGIGCFRGPKLAEDLPASIMPALSAQPWTFGALADRLANIPARSGA